MSEILQEMVVGLITFITTGGLGSILYFRLQKKLKEAEVKSAEIDNKNKEIANMAAVNSEWEKMTQKLSLEREELVNEIHMQLNVIRSLNEKIDELNTSKDNAWKKYSDAKIDCAKKERLISELNWYRCEINGCPYRKPPRKYGDYDFPENAVVKTDEQ